jgi:hippurate hydrolase
MAKTQPESLTRIADFADELIRIRRDIHAHPELAYEERRTADVVAAELEACGLEVHRGLGETGVVASLTCGASRRAVGLRADMDALSLDELNNFAHRSRHEGKMHACGHDGHTAMLLGAARHLAGARDFNGTVHFIFQPAEEGHAGARRMMDDGLFEKFPVDCVFGMHNMPGTPEGKFRMRVGPIMASGELVTIKITGRGGHAARPKQAIDPVVVAGHVITALQTVVSRNTDPLENVVVSITRMNAGSAFNIIPETAELAGTIRTFDMGVQEQTRDAVRRIVEGVAAALGASAEVDFRLVYPPTVNWPAEVGIAAGAAARVVGAENVDADCDPMMGAEDFAFMLAEKPGCYVLIGNGEDETDGRSLHSPHYDFNDDILAIGASYWVELVHTVLGES